MQKPYSATNGPVPQHNTFIFDDISFSSDFDSGNLAKVERKDANTFFLWTGPDCCNTLSEKNFRSWYYFKISAVGEYHFTIKNLNLQGKLFRDGMKPLIKTPSRSWERLESAITCDIAGEVASFFEISFTYNFTESFAYFSFSFPWSYADQKHFLSWLPSQFSSDSIYFHQENLINSLEKRSCDILTISSYDRITWTREESLQNLYENSEDRALLFKNKPIVFISARVHPGESPSSYVVNGFLKFLVSNDPKAQFLRKLYVFKIVPMINPDGVFRGYFRTDTRGNDLNRNYNSPHLLHHPTIYAITELLKSYKENLWMYIDCHSHVSKQGCFIYGNSLEFELQIQNVVFAKVLSLICPWFSYENCCFSDENLRNDENSFRNVSNSKEGCGRVVVHKKCKIVNSYTFECNYHSCKTSSKLENCLLDVNVFEKIGASIGISLLNFSKNYEGSDINLPMIELEVSQILAEMPAFKTNPEIRKASKSIENLTKYLDLCKNKKLNRFRISNLFKEIERPVKASSNTSKNNLPKIKENLKIIEQINNLTQFSTKCIIGNNNSFQIRNRNSSYIKPKKNKKNRIKSSNIREKNNLDIILL